MGLKWKKIYVTKTKGTIHPIETKVVKNHQNGLLFMPSSICRRDSSWVTSGIWWAGTNAKFEFNLLIVGCRVLETK